MDTETDYKPHSTELQLVVASTLNDRRVTNLNLDAGQGGGGGGGGGGGDGGEDGEGGGGGGGGGGDGGGDREGGGGGMVSDLVWIDPRRDQLLVLSHSFVNAISQLAVLHTLQGVGGGGGGGGEGGGGGGGVMRTWERRKMHSHLLFINDCHYLLLDLFTEHSTGHLTCFLQRMENVLLLFLLLLC